MKEIFKIITIRNQWLLFYWEDLGWEVFDAILSDSNTMSWKVHWIALDL